jgi:hypothetical protein
MTNNKRRNTDFELKVLESVFHGIVFFLIIKLRKQYIHLCLKSGKIEHTKTNKQTNKKTKNSNQSHKPNITILSLEAMSFQCFI